MRKSKIAVCFMMALLLSVAAASELIQREHFPLSVTIAGTETIDCWRKDGCYYVFLPGYADGSQAKLVTNPLFPVSIDGQKVGKDTVCADFPLGQRLPIVYSKWGKAHEAQVLFCQSGNLPTLYIDTASGSMDYIHKEKGNAESGKLRLYRDDGTLDCDAQISAINGRGNATWESDKKPYSLELTQKTDLLGMGKAKKWILLANYYDDSNISNKLSFDFAAEVGCAYTPECQ